MERQERAGTLVEAADVKRAWLSILMVVRTRLLALPSRLAPRLVGKTVPEIAAAVKQEVHDVLSYLSKTDDIATEFTRAKETQILRLIQPAHFWTGSI